MSGAPSGRPAWPWPADTVLDRARRLAQSYRAALVDHAPDVAVRLDQWAVDHGQGWIIGRAWTYADDDLLTTFEVAELCHVQERTVRDQWRRRGLPFTSTVDGERVRMEDLVAWERARRRRRLRDQTP